MPSLSTTNSGTHTVSLPVFNFTFAILSVIEAELIPARHQRWNMVHCPECQSELDHVETELLDLSPSAELDVSADGGKAVATVCPHCGVLLDL